LRDKRVAVERGRASGELLKRDVPGVELLEVESTAEALRAVSVGKASAYVGGLVASTWAMRKNTLTNLEVRAEAATLDSSIGFAAGKALPVLAGIFRKGVESFTDAEHAGVRQRWLFDAAPARAAARVTLSADNRGWLGRHGPVKYGLPRAEWPPFDLFDKSG